MIRNTTLKCISVLIQNKQVLSYHCMIKWAAVQEVSESKVCTMFISHSWHCVCPSLCSKTTVYGLGSALSRRRRSTCRCTCANPDDQTCASFCRQRWVKAPEHPKQLWSRAHVRVKAKCYCPLWRTRSGISIPTVIIKLYSRGLGGWMISVWCTKSVSDWLWGRRREARWEAIRS